MREKPAKPRGQTTRPLAPPQSRSLAGVPSSPSRSAAAAILAPRIAAGSSTAAWVSAPQLSRLRARQEIHEIRSDDDDNHRCSQDQHHSIAPARLSTATGLDLHPLMPRSCRDLALGGRASGRLTPMFSCRGPSLVQARDPELSIPDAGAQPNDWSPLSAATCS